MQEPNKLESRESHCWEFSWGVLTKFHFFFFFSLEQPMTGHKTNGIFSLLLIQLSHNYSLKLPEGAVGGHKHYLVVTLGSWGLHLTICYLMQQLNSHLEANRTIISHLLSWVVMFPVEYSMVQLLKLDR